MHTKQGQDHKRKQNCYCERKQKEKVIMKRNRDCTKTYCWTKQEYYVLLIKHNAYTSIYNVESYMYI